MNTTASNRRSSEDLLVVHQGATVSDLATIFDMSSHEVNRRIVGKVVPKTLSNKIPRYAIRDAAPYLCNVIFDPEEFIKKMAPEKLPSRLQDAFWKAQLNRLKYEEEKGDLWRTSRVIEVLAEVNKTIRMTALMFSDTVEQRAELSSEQRRIIQELSDGLLQMAHQNLVGAFKDYEAVPDEHGRTLEEETHAPLVIGERDKSSDEVEDDGFDDGFD